MTAPHKSSTRVKHTRSGRLGLLVRIDAAGEPVVTIFGSATEFPFPWSEVEILSSDEFEMVEGGFELGLYVDGEGDAWREEGLSPAGETLFNVVSSHGLHVTPYPSPWTREMIVEFTGALEPAGSPAARHIREAHSDRGDDDAATLMGCGIGLLLSGAVVALAFLALFFWVLVP